MNIIINNYYEKIKQLNINIYIVELEKHQKINDLNSTRCGNNLIYKLHSLDNSYQILNSSNIEFKLGIMIKNKLIFNNTIKQLNFKIINNIIKIFDNNEFNKLRNNHRKNVNKSGIKFWNIWWYCLHYISYLYPDKPNSSDKKKIINLVNKMKDDGIHCGKCKYHFTEWCKKNNIIKFINCKNDLIEFFINLHNDINKRNQKIIYSRSKVDEIYNNYNDQLLLDYGIDIKILMRNNTLFELPVIMNRDIRQKLLKEFNIVNFA